MEHDRDLVTLMATVANELQEAGDEQLTSRAVVEMALSVLPDAEWASITVTSSRRGHVTLAATAPLAREVDALQYALGEGPCVEVADQDSDFLRTGDVARHPSWPTWGPRAAELGVTSLLSVPLFSHSKRMGALNLYAAAPGCFGDREAVDLAQVYAVHAAHALTAARDVSNLEVALSSRHTIGVAQGIVMARYDLTLTQSFDFLRRLSSQTETKLALLAREIAATGAVPPGAHVERRSSGH